MLFLFQKNWNHKKVKIELKLKNYKMFLFCLKLGIVSILTNNVDGQQLDVKRTNPGKICFIRVIIHKLSIVLRQYWDSQLRL